jgi:AraC-like DNA-binding protein/quercetin dioxygenase-like cupin family protein
MRMGEAKTGSKRLASAAVPGVLLMGIDGARIPYRGVKEHFSVAWMLAGRADIWRRGRTRTYAAGAIIANQAGDVHSDRRIESPVTYRIAAFEPEHVMQARAALGLSTHSDLDIGEIDPRSPGAERVRNMHRTLFASHSVVAEQEEAIREGLGALIGLARHPRTPREPREAPAFVRRAQDFMRERQDDGLRIQAAADAAGIDQFRLIRAFRQHVGMSPYEWLTQLRIQRAKTLLAAGHSATDVAQQLGYFDQSQLHRHFRRIVGTTPGAYARELSRTRWWPTLG